MLELYLIRHGKSTWNQSGRIQGQADAPLAKEGMKQAELLATRLTNAWFDVIYASDLERALQTAEIAFPDREIKTDRRLREGSMGVFEGRMWEELTEEEQAQLAVWYAGPYEQKVPGGESNDDMKERSLSWLKSLPKVGRVAAVTHGGFIESLLCSIVGRPSPRDWRVASGWGFVLQNTSLSKLRITPDFKAIEYIGDAAHLEAFK
jgi:broad specificity phosphatase PhoE